MSLPRQGSLPPADGRRGSAWQMICCLSTIFFNYVSWLSPRYMGGFLGASSSRGLHHLAQRWSHTALGTCALQVLSGHRSPGRHHGRQAWAEGCLFEACYFLPFRALLSTCKSTWLVQLWARGPCSCHGRQRSISLSSKSIHCGHVALSEAAYSRPSLYVHTRPNEGTLTKAGPTKRRV